jgi:hypothetical protein
MMKKDSRLNFIFINKRDKEKPHGIRAVMKSYDFTIAKKKSFHPLFGI